MNNENFPGLRYHIAGLYSSVFKSSLSREIKNQRKICTCDSWCYSTKYVLPSVVVCKISMPLLQYLRPVPDDFYDPRSLCIEEFMLGGGGRGGVHSTALPGGSGGMPPQENFEK